MKRHHYAPVTAATALEATELDYVDAVALCESTDYGNVGDLAELADAHDAVMHAREGWPMSPAPALAVPVFRDTMSQYVSDRAPHLAGPRHRAAVAVRTVATLHQPRHRAAVLSSALFARAAR